MEETNLFRKVDNLITERTGVNLDGWKRRGKEFVRNPDRRDEMMLKLVVFLGGYRDRMLGRESEYRLESKEILNGVETYHFVDVLNPEYSHHSLSVMPENALVSICDTPKPELGTSLLARLINEEPRRGTYLTTGPIVDNYGYEYGEVPILGTYDHGACIKETKIDRGPNWIDEEFEMAGGGIVIEGGKMTVLEHTNFMNKALNADYGFQAIFVADESSIDVVTANDRIVQNVGQSMFFLGYFTDPNKENRYFAMSTMAVFGGANGRKIYEDLQSVAKRHGYRQWKIACIEFGGGFGAVGKTTDTEGNWEISGTSCFSVKDKEKKYSKTKKIGEGHLRSRFFRFSWDQ